MGWDRHKLLWDGTDKYVSWTTLGYIATLNYRKIIRNTQKHNNLYWKPLKPKYMPSGGPVSTFSLPEEAICPSAPVTYAPGYIP